MFNFFIQKLLNSIKLIFSYLSFNLSFLFIRNILIVSSNFILVVLVLNIV